MEKFGVSELKNFFVEGDIYKKKDELEDEDNDKIDYKLFLASNGSSSTICKIYDPYRISHNMENSINKKGMSWYKQLMIFRECFLLNRFNHPAIANFKGVNLYNKTIAYYEDPEDEYPDYFEDEEEDNPKIQIFKTNPTLFLEYIPNGSFDSYATPLDRSSKKSKLTPAQRQICILGLTSAVNYLHNNNIIHRSINPKTIWFDENYYPKLFDFSTTREMEQESENDQTSLYPDSLYYIAPEIMKEAENPSNYNNSIDIFALARVIYYFVTGFHPFRFKDMIDGKLVEDPSRKLNNFTLNESILKGLVTPFLPDSVPPKLKELLLKCWSNNPSDRPQAPELLYNLLNNDDCILSELKNSKYMDEYNKYKERILAFEESQIIDEPTNKPFELCIKKSFDFEEFLYDEDVKLKYKTTKEKKDHLEQIIKSNFRAYSADEIFKLLLEMAKDGSIMENNYLAKIIEFVNRQNLKNFSPAESFLKIVFGDYIINSKETHEITSTLIQDQKSIKQANIPPWITKIKKGAFKDFTNLERVNIPNSVLEIDDEAFLGCTKLQFVNIPYSIERNKIGKKVFMNCTSLTYIKTPPYLTTIKEATFKNDSALIKVDLNENLKIIEKEAFYNCKSLVNQKLPSTLSKIGRKAFEKDK